MNENAEPICTVDVSPEDGGTVAVTLHGELDLATIPEVESAVGLALAGKPRRLIIDLSGLRFADSSAIALWVRWAMTIDHFELRDPPPFLRRVIAAMGLSECLGVAA